MNNDIYFYTCRGMMGFLLLQPKWTHTWYLINLHYSKAIWVLFFLDELILQNLFLIIYMFISTKHFFFNTKQTASKDELKIQYLKTQQVCIRTILLLYWWIDLIYYWIVIVINLDIRVTILGNINRIINCHFCVKIS